MPPTQPDLTNSLFLSNITHIPETHIQQIYNKTNYSRVATNFNPNYVKPKQACKVSKNTNPMETCQVALDSNQTQTQISAVATNNNSNSEEYSNLNVKQKIQLFENHAKQKT